ncbi:FAKD4 protein, partial [Halcyon senegalensis]|nr:FAKD4 protein [Halcyon senegalensis]
MAARLVRRCCWRHWGAFVSPAARGRPRQVPLGPVPTARVLPLASFHPSSPWSRADGFSVQEQVEEGRNPEHRVIGELIETAASPRELFQLSELHPLNSNQASLVITRLSRLAAEQKLDARSILQDRRFQQLLSLTDSQISQVWNNTLVNLLKSLYSLGVDSSRPEMQSVEQEVLWRLRRLSFRQLASLAEFLALRQGKESKLLAEVIKKLELRWTELEGTRTVVMLMGKVGNISPALMDRLEDKALELAEQFSPDDIRRITLALAYQNRRCVPLLRALSYHLSQKHGELGRAVLTDLIFAYGKLNFHQPQVFQKIAGDLQPHVASMTPAEVTRCVRSFALLKWLSLPLCEAVAQYALDNTKQLSVTHLCGIILAFARLNFQPSSSEDFFTMVHEKLQGQLESLEPGPVTELVWSLCVLQQAKAPYLQRVLAPDFHAQLRGEVGDPLPAGRGLNTPQLGQGRGDAEPAPSERVHGWLGRRGSVSADLPSGGSLDFGVSPPLRTDAELVLNSENKPLPVKDFAAPHLLHSEGTKPLPPGARR